eukprot:739917_1
MELTDLMESTLSGARESKSSPPDIISKLESWKAEIEALTSLFNAPDASEKYARFKYTLRKKRKRRRWRHRQSLARKAAKNTENVTETEISSISERSSEEANKTLSDATTDNSNENASGRHAQAPFSLNYNRQFHRQLNTTSMSYDITPLKHPSEAASKGHPKTPNTPGSYASFSKSPRTPARGQKNIFGFPDTTSIQNYGSIEDSASSTHQSPTMLPQTSETANFWGMILVASFLAFWTISAAIISNRQGSTLQWALSRYIIMLLFCVLHWICKKPTDHTHFYGDNKRDTFIIILHGILENTWVYTYFYALHTVYIGDIEAIFLFVAPTMIALIGRMVFKEQFPPNILIIVLIDIVGVIFVTQPSFIFPREQSMSNEGMMLILVSTVIYSLDIVLIGQNDQIHWLQMQIGASLQGCFIYFPVIFVLNMVYSPGDVIIGGWFDLSKEMLGCNAAVGVVNLLSQICLIYGYQMGASTKVVWLEYINLIFAYGIQWIIFREISDLYEIIGASLIASTFFIQFGQQYMAFRREQNNKTLKEITGASEEGKV